MYGNGSYFAKDASYSNCFSTNGPSRRKFMFLSLVLLGASTTGERNLMRPPPLDRSKPNGNFYNSCVNNVENPTIFVVFHDDQSYPEYLIEYESKSVTNLTTGLSPTPANGAIYTAYPSLAYNAEPRRKLNTLRQTKAQNQQLLSDAQQQRTYKCWCFNKLFKIYSYVFY